MDTVNFQNATNYISFSKILKNILCPTKFSAKRFHFRSDSHSMVLSFHRLKVRTTGNSLHSSSIIGQGFSKKEDYFDVYNTLLQHTTLFQWRWNYINFQNWRIASLMRIKGSKYDQRCYVRKALWDTLTLYVKWKFSLPQLRTSVPPLASPVLIKITDQISLQRLQLSSLDEKTPARVNGLRSFTRRRFSRLR